MDIEFRASRPADEDCRRAQVAAGHGYPAEFLAYVGMAHQQVAKRIVEMVPPGDPAGLVQQPDGRAVVEPGALGPGKCAQGQGQRLGLARPPGLGNQLFSRAAVLVGVGYDVIVRPPRTYQKVG